MSTENDQLLALICSGDTLHVLHRLLAEPAGGGPRLAMNRALYGPAGEASGEQVRAADQVHRERMGALDAEQQVTALYNLGCFALSQDDVMEARLRFAEVLEREPEHVMARHNLAYAHELLAETAEARQEYEAVLARQPDLALARLNLSQLALAEGDHEQGIELLEALHAQAPDNMGLLLYLCRGLLLRATPQDLERVLELLAGSGETGRYVDLQECAAYAHFLLGDLEAAEAAFRALLDADANNVFALTGMMKVLAQRVDLAGLKTYADRLQALFPTEAVAGVMQELAGG